MVIETTFLRREALIDALLTSVSAGDLDVADTFFTAEARIVRVRYADGIAEGAEVIAHDRDGVRSWFDQNIARSLLVRATEYWEEGDCLAVRAEWSLSGFDGERVCSSSLGIYDFEGDLIRLLRVTSRDEEGRGRASRCDGMQLRVD
jgi:hypothetical protein